MNQYNSYRENKKNKHPISIKKFYPTDFLCLNQQFHLDILIIPSHPSYTIKFNHKIRQPAYSRLRREKRKSMSERGGEERGLFSFFLWFCEQWNDKKMENTQKKNGNESHAKNTNDWHRWMEVMFAVRNVIAWIFTLGIFGEYFRISSCFFASRPVELKIRARADKRRSTMIVFCHASLSFLLRWRSKKIASTPITTSAVISPLQWYSNSWYEMSSSQSIFFFFFC